MPEEDEPKDDDRPDDKRPDSTAEAAAEFAKQLREAIRQGRVAPKERLVDPLTQEERRTDIELKRLYAKGILWILSGQILIVNVGMFLYGFGVDWKVDPTIFQVWLTATVVEVIAIVLVVTRYLFPSRKSDS